MHIVEIVGDTILTCQVESYSYIDKSGQLQSWVRYKLDVLITKVSCGWICYSFILQGNIRLNQKLHVWSDRLHVLMSTFKIWTLIKSSGICTCSYNMYKETYHSLGMVTSGSNQMCKKNSAIVLTEPEMCKLCVCTMH